MKGLIIKAIIVVLIALGASNYLLYIKTGKLPFDFGNMKVPSGISLPDMPSLPQGKTEAYKWTDARGVTHYSSEPPTEANKIAKRLEVDPNTNLIQGSRPAVEINPNVDLAPTDEIPQGLNAYDPKNVKKLMDDAKAIQETMNARAKQLEGI